MGSFFDIGYMLRSFPVVLSYVDTTLIITVVGVTIGFLIGCIAALVRIGKVVVLGKAVAVYISFIRGTPFLVQLFLAYFGLPELMQKVGYQGVREIPPLFYVFIVFSLHVGAYSAEILRSAILAVDKGQLEAAYSVGMGLVPAHTRIILPQAFSIAVPALCNTVISTIKETSLVFNVGIIDMMRKADLLGANSHRSLELYLDVAIIYIFLVLLVSKAAASLESKRVSHY
ncbi:MAG: polar amino acid transporter, inner rane subunit [Anaerosporomusa subterranea]|nr:polar amino acid transporter, inner rane subunit [Anaerosporomusa subterranea]